GFDVNYFPNPTTDVVNIVTKITFDNVELLNTEGKIVRRLENLGIGTHQLDLSDLPAAMYLLRFQKGETVLTKKILLVRA
ncbi:MAG: Secretion system C-terminal sorting domain, partial [Bacteroidota bacterium]